MRSSAPRSVALLGPTDIINAPTPSSRRADPSCSDEELFRALRDADPAERERIQDLLVRRHAGLVRWIAGQYADSPVDMDELRQVGYLGLVLAIQRFDVDRGAEFTAFAKPTVQGEIRRYFRDKRRWIRLARRLQEAKATLRKAAEVMLRELGREPTVEELAERSRLSAEMVLEALAADDNFAPTSLDSPASSETGDSLTIADLVGGDDERIERFLHYDALRPLLEKLPERERRILHLRFYEEKTQAQIGQELGVSQMHVSRLLNRTLDALRSDLVPA